MIMRVYTSNQEITLPYIMYEFFKIEKKAVTTNSIYEQGSLYSIKAIHFKTYTILR